MKISEIYKIRSKTNAGEFAKQSFCIAWNTKDDMSLIIDKLVLTNRVESYTLSGYKQLKEFKGMVLFHLQFSIRLSTLSMVTKWINSLNNQP